MNLTDKLHILADSAKYDVSCSSSGSSRGKKAGAVGNASLAGICHSWADDGRCISLLKVLFSNACVYDCAYCINRSSNDIARASFTPDELAELTINFYRRNYIEGLFLSSGVQVSPDFTMERMIAALYKLRYVYKFNGYIHMKTIPGSSQELVRQAGLLVDRLSVNIELPSVSGLERLAPQKSAAAILEPMAFVHESIKERKGLLPTIRHTPDFVPAGQSTQLIVGATRDTDLRILRLSEALYQKFSLKRVYYSAYMPINEVPGVLPAVHVEPPLLREHRMYQADWLLRFYGFAANELLDEKHDSFDARIDPKADWAVRHLERFPIEINKAPYEMILRVPGIGLISAKRIIAARRFGSLTFADLVKMRVVMKRARNFIVCNGKFDGERGHGKESLVRVLTDGNSMIAPSYEQMSLFGKSFGKGRTALELPDGIDGYEGLPIETKMFFPEPLFIGS